MSTEVNTLNEFPPGAFDAFQVFGQGAWKFFMIFL
jgi:hypothetical protein